MFENFLPFVVGGVYISLIEQVFETPGNWIPLEIPKQELAMKKSTRSRRANIRLARFLVVASLATVFGAGFAMQSGATSKAIPAKADSYVTVTVAPGETIWSIAKQINNGGDVRKVVDQIISANDLASSDLSAGTKIRVPLN